MKKINRKKIKTLINKQVKKNLDLIKNFGCKDKNAIKILLEKIEIDFLSENNLTDQIENKLKEKEIFLVDLDLDDIKELRAKAMHKVLDYLKETYFFQKYLVDCSLNYKNFYIEYCFKNNNYKLIFETKRKNIFVKYLNHQELQDLDQELEKKLGYYYCKDVATINYLIDKFCL